MKLGLYSITFLGVWYDGPALTIEALIDRARAYGYEGIEIDGKRPHGNPLDLSLWRRQELRARAADAGVPIYAVAANNDFSSPIPEHREAQLVYTRALIDMTADLGCRVLRLFCAWPGVTKTAHGATYEPARRVWRIAQHEAGEDQAWARCRDGLVECTRWAADRGVTLALQNHAPVINNHHDMLRMIDEVGSPALQACFDAPLAHRHGVPSMYDASLDVRGRQVLSHFGGEYDRDADGRVTSWVRNPDGSLTPEAFYADFARAMAEIGYDGYVGYELCHPLPDVEGRPAGLEFAEKNAQLAAEYMRGVLARQGTAASPVTAPS